MNAVKFLYVMFSDKTALYNLKLAIKFAII